MSQVGAKHILQKHVGSRNPNDVISSVHKTIADLNVGYLDLLLIHSPFGKPCPLIDTWKAMERLVDDGFVRHIGVSNHRIQDLQEILNSSKHRPVMNQVECHPALPQLKLKQFCEANDIIMASYGNLLPITRKPKECDPLKKTNESLKDNFETYMRDHSLSNKVHKKFGTVNLKRYVLNFIKTAKK